MVGKLPLDGMICGPFCVLKGVDILPGDMSHGVPVAGKESGVAGNPFILEPTKGGEFGSAKGSFAHTCMLVAAFPQL